MNHSCVLISTGALSSGTVWLSQRPVGTDLKGCLECQEEQALPQVGKCYHDQARRCDVQACGKAPAHPGSLLVLAPKGMSLKARGLGRTKEPSKMTRLMGAAQVTTA